MPLFCKRQGAPGAFNSGVPDRRRGGGWLSIEDDSKINFLISQ